MTALCLSVVCRSGYISGHRHSTESVCCVGLVVSGNTLCLSVAQVWLCLATVTVLYLSCVCLAVSRHRDSTVSICCVGLAVSGHRHFTESVCCIGLAVSGSKQSSFAPKPPSSKPSSTASNAKRKPKAA